MSRPEEAEVVAPDTKTGAVLADIVDIAEDMLHGAQKAGRERDRWKVQGYTMGEGNLRIDVHFNKEGGKS